MVAPGLELEVGMDPVHQVGRPPRASRGRARSVARGIGARRIGPRHQRRSARPCRAGSRPSCAGSARTRVAHRLPGDRRGLGAASGRSPTSTSQRMRHAQQRCGPCRLKWVTPLPKLSRPSCRSSGARLDAQLVRQHALPRQLARRQVGELPRLRHRRAVGVARLVLDAVALDRHRRAGSRHQRQHAARHARARRTSARSRPRPRTRRAAAAPAPAPAASLSGSQIVAAAARAARRAPAPSSVAGEAAVASPRAWPM